MNIPSLIFGFLAVGLYLLCFQLKSTKEIIAAKFFSSICYVLQYFLLGAFVGAAMDALSVLTYAVGYKKDSPIVKKHKVTILIFTNALIVTVGILLYDNVFSILPILGVLFESASNWMKKEKTLRIISLFAVPCWFVYNVACGAYGSAVGSVLAFISIITALARYEKISKEQGLMPKLKEYTERFNKNDEETVIQKVRNEDAFAFLCENAPRLECPDEVIEETFAFRTWTIRKHLKDTADGLMMTEFLPSVPWSGKHNTINAPLFHHLNEYRWFKNAKELNDYLFFFLENKGENAYDYTTPALTAMYEFLTVTGNDALIIENADKFEAYFKKWEELHLTESGLYWSIDDNDAMEWSISGSTPEKDGKALHDEWLKGNRVKGTARPLKGLRPTMNAYMYGDAVTLSRIFALSGNKEKSDFYLSRAKKIKSLTDERLWDGEFYKAIHAESITEDLSYKDIRPEMNVRELIGYIPWIYAMPDQDKAKAFALLKDEECFKAETGFATADKSHERFLYERPHECLWNGYVWPFATSQTINAVISLLNNYEETVISDRDLYDFIYTYAKMHYTVDERGRHSFIDEVMYPDKPIWSSREELKALGWKPIKGGYERGKDYNHSTFIDLVIRGLVGVDINADTLSVKPRVAGIWKWFSLENLTYKNKVYNIYYDEDGTRYGKGCGITVEEKGL